jgi:hypothetical protein
MPSGGKSPRSPGFKGTRIMFNHALNETSQSYDHKQTSSNFVLRQKRGPNFDFEGSQNGSNYKSQRILMGESPDVTRIA